MRAQREFANQRAALFDLAEEFLILLRVNHVYAGPQHSDCRSARCPASALVRQTVDAACHAANDHQAVRGQVMPQALRHLVAVGSWPARAYHRNRMPVEQAGVSAHVKQWWGIVDLQEALRIFRLAPIEQAATQRADL